MNSRPKSKEWRAPPKATIHNMGCFEGLSRLPAGSVDVVITDVVGASFASRTALESHVEHFRAEAERALRVEGRVFVFSDPGTAPVLLAEFASWGNAVVLVLDAAESGMRRVRRERWVFYACRADYVPEQGIPAGLPFKEVSARVRDPLSLLGILLEEFEEVAVHVFAYEGTSVALSTQPHCVVGLPPF